MFRHKYIFILWCIWCMHGLPWKYGKFLLVFSSESKFRTKEITQTSSTKTTTIEDSLQNHSLIHSMYYLENGDDMSRILRLHSMPDNEYCLWWKTNIVQYIHVLMYICTRSQLSNMTPRYKKPLSETQVTRIRLNNTLTVKITSFHLKGRCIKIDNKSGTVKWYINLK